MSYRNRPFVFVLISLVQIAITNPRAKALLGLPAWLNLALGTVVMAVGAAFLVQITREWKRQERVRSGLCGRCGYDLRASPERCPECSTAAPSPART